MNQKLRVWHIPQVPGKPFYVDVSSIEDGIRMMDCLADYDLFQYDNNIKGDYCNVNGLEMQEDGEWVSWGLETDCGEYFEDPRDYLEWKEDQNG